MNEELFSNVYNLLNLSSQDIIAFCHKSSKSDFDYVFDNKLFWYCNLKFLINNYKMPDSNEYTELGTSVKIHDWVVDFLAKIVQSNLPVSIVSFNWFQVGEYYENYTRILNLLKQLDFDISTIYTGDEDPLRSLHILSPEKWFLTTVSWLGSLSHVEKCNRLIMTSEVVDSLTEDKLCKAKSIQVSQNWQFSDIPDSLKHLVKMITFPYWNSFEGNFNDINSEFVNLTDIDIEWENSDLNQLKDRLESLDPKWMLKCMGICNMDNISKVMSLTVRYSSFLIGTKYNFSSDALNFEFKNNYESKFYTDEKNFQSYSVYNFKEANIYFTPTDVAAVHGEYIALKSVVAYEIDQVSKADASWMDVQQQELKYFLSEFAFKNLWDSEFEDSNDNNLIIQITKFKSKLNFNH